MGWHQNIIIGNLGRDPELRHLPNSGQTVCNFSVAVSERWRDRQSGEQREKTTWYNVSVWGPMGETCNRYLSRGRQVMIAGTVSARGYTNQAGEAAASLDMNARTVQFLGGRQDSGAGGGGGRDSYQAQDDFAPPARRQAPSQSGSGSSVFPGEPQYEDVEDDIPF